MNTGVPLTPALSRWEREKWFPFSDETMAGFGGAIHRFYGHDQWLFLLPWGEVRMRGTRASVKPAAMLFEARQ